MFKKNTAVTGFGIGNFINATTGAIVTTGTPVETRMLDGVGAALTNAATYNSGASEWEIDLAAGDMNADVVGLTFKLTDCIPISYTIHTTLGVPQATIAATGDEMDLVDAPNATAVTAIQSGLATPTNITAGTIANVTNAVVTDTASRTASQADVSGLATSSALSTHDGKLDTVDGVVDAILVDTGEIGAAGAGLTAIIGANGDTLETLSEQIDNIGAGGTGALNFGITGDNTGGAIKGVTFVGSQTGTYANIDAADGVVHEITDTGNAFDIVYQTNVGGNFAGIEAKWVGILNSGNDIAYIQAYDFVGTDWETIHEIDGRNGDTYETQALSLLAKHTGTGADLGSVLIRIVTTGQSSPNLFTDQLIVAAVNTSQSIGYSNGQIWIDTINGIAGSTAYLNGTADNPSNNLTDALSLSGTLGIRRFHIVSGSTVDLIDNASGMVGSGENWALGLEGELVTNASVTGATITGSPNITSTGTEFIDSHFSTAVGLTPSHSVNCGFQDEVTLLAVGTYVFVNCFSEVAGTGTPVLDFAALGACYVNFRNYSGGIEIENMAAGDTMSLEGNGQLKINANCSAGTVAIRGNFTVTDSAGGNVTLSDDARIDVGQIDTTITANALIADIPSTSEFNARTLASADYLVEGDTLARVTLVDTVTTNTDLVSAADVRTAMEASGSDLHYLMIDQVNKKIITEANGNTEQFTDGDVSIGSITAAYTSDGTYTTRKRMVQ